MIQAYAIETIRGLYKKYPTFYSGETNHVRLVSSGYGGEGDSNASVIFYIRYESRFFLFSNVSNLYSQRSIQPVNIIVYGSSELFIKTPVHFQNRQPTYLNDERYVLE